MLATGFFLSRRLQFIQLRHFFLTVRTTLGSLLVKKERLPAGEITPFQALSTALAATVGTGNIAGVATAIYLGGPGAVFWIWVSAFLGMATKYSEILLAVHYRTRIKNEIVGGPMYYLAGGLKSPLMAVLFALFGSLAAFGIGNMVQANSVADAVQASFGVPAFLTGLLLSFFSALIILGGIRRIARVASALVPLMAFFYVAGSLIILISFRQQLPGVLVDIFASAFRGRAAAGGFAGATVLGAWRYGISRGIFTNEAGLGSAPIAHAAARTPHPVSQGLWGIMEVFIDTHFICTLTALVLLATGAWQTGLEGASMAVEAFNRGLPGNAGHYVVSLGLIFFAFTTLLSWSYYGEKCLEYLLGNRAVRFYRFLWIILIFIGAVSHLQAIWTAADILNGLMALPNLVGLLGLSGVICRITKDYFCKRD
ncbi:MAG: sodium:alanine symporter family protein [Firmicutes bacterium]|nr:sodium:alanine symporter family protein [Bacillota bacterium]